jgi:hypothetical protein
MPSFSKLFAFVVFAASTGVLALPVAVERERHHPLHHFAPYIYILIFDICVRTPNRRTHNRR